MKKLYLVISVSMLAVLNFAAFSWAGEASVFDDIEKVVIRAYTEVGADSNCGPNETGQCYSVFLEARDPFGNFFSPACQNNVIVTDLASPSSPIQGVNGVYTIHDDSASSPDVSLTFDNGSGTALLFCKDNAGVMPMRYSVINNNTGVCGASNGQSFRAGSEITNLCTSGTASSIGGSGPWTWVCVGVEACGGANANCSATKIVDGACDSRTNGQSFTSAPTANLCSYTSTTPTVSGTGPWTWSCTGSNGGNSPTCSAPLGGTCGPAKDMTFTSAPAANDSRLCATGSTRSVTTNPDTYSWTCNGSTGGNNANCSATRAFTVTPSAGSGGSISPNTAQTVAYNQTKQFTVTPNAGYSASVSGNCGGSPTSSQNEQFVYTTGQIISNCNVSVAFTALPLRVLPDLQCQITGLSATQQGGTWTETVAIKNAGSVSATGHFVVRMWRNICGKLSCNNTGTVDAVLVKTWDSVTDGHITEVGPNTTCMSNIWCAAGTYPPFRVTSGPFTTLGMTVHTQYYMITTVDADNEIEETNESNNTCTRGLMYD